MVERSWGYENSRGEWTRHGWCTEEFDQTRLPGWCEAWYRHGKRDGPSYWIDPSGRLAGEEHYREGELHGPERRWWPGRTVLREDAYWEGGSRHGGRTTFYRDGRIEAVQHYWHGRPVGKWSTQSPSGSFYTECEYRFGVLWGKALTRVSPINLSVLGGFRFGVPWEGDFLTTTGVGLDKTFLTVYRVIAYRRGKRHGRCFAIAETTGECLAAAVYARDRPENGSVLVRLGTDDFLKVYQDGKLLGVWTIELSHEGRIVRKHKVDLDPSEPKDWSRGQF